MNRRSATLFAVLLTLLACGKSTAAPDAAPPERVSLPEAPVPPGPGKPRGPLATDVAAIAAFRAAWVEEISPPSKTHSRRGQSYDKAVLQGQPHPPRAQLMTCREGYKRSLSSLAATEEGKNLHLFATMAALQRDGDCWKVAAGSLSGTVEAYFDAKTGALVYSLIQPEG